jgi:hypothetical protein
MKMIIKDRILINILTRTSNRPNYFKKNRESIKKQTYKHIRHIIHADSIKDIPYIKETGVNESDIICSGKMLPTREMMEYKTDKGLMYLAHRPSNLYLNKLTKEVDEGWIMFLDDDDIVLSKTSILKLAVFLKACGKNDFVFFKARFVNMSRMLFKRYTLPKKKIAYKILEGKPPNLGEIGGICFTYHCDKKHLIKWDEYSGSDYRVFLQLMRECNAKFLPTRITGVYDKPNGASLVDLAR